MARSMPGKVWLYFHLWMRNACMLLWNKSIQTSQMKKVSFPSFFFHLMILWHISYKHFWCIVFSTIPLSELCTLYRTSMDVSLDASTLTTVLKHQSKSAGGPNCLKGAENSMEQKILNCLFKMTMMNQQWIWRNKLSDSSQKKSKKGKSCQLWPLWLSLKIVFTFCKFLNSTRSFWNAFFLTVSHKPLVHIDCSLYPLA